MTKGHVEVLQLLICRLVTNNLLSLLINSYRLHLFIEIVEILLITNHNNLNFYFKISYLIWSIAKIPQSSHFIIMWNSKLRLILLVTSKNVSHLSGYYNTIFSSWVSDMFDKPTDIQGICRTAIVWLWMCILVCNSLTKEEWSVPLYDLTKDQVKTHFRKPSVLLCPQQGERDW